MPKRSADTAVGAGDAAAAGHHQHTPKRSRTGFHAALPTSDDAWRRKLEKTKEAKVRLAKTRQVYAKVKARALAEGADKADDAGDADDADDADDGPVPEAMHPERQARLAEDGDDNDERHEDDDPHHHHRGSRRAKRPQPFQKDREEAEQRRAEAEARQAAFAQRMAERDAKRAERARQQKAMAKARRVDTHAGGGGGRGGGGGGGGGGERRKLGREGGVLLDRVRKLMGK